MLSAVTKCQRNNSFSLIRATCPTHHILLDLIILLYVVKSTSYEAPHYAVFSNRGGSLYLSVVYDQADWHWSDNLDSTWKLLVQISPRPPDILAEVFHVFFNPNKCQNSTSLMPWTFPSKSFPIHPSLHFIPYCLVNKCHRTLPTPPKKVSQYLTLYSTE
jgi:hypothetical protein